MPAGRPGLDKIKIGQDFVKWATDNIDALTVPQFASKQGIVSTTMIHWCHEDEEFKQLYMRAKELIGINRLKSSMLPGPVPKLSDNVYQKTLWHYDLDIKHEVREDKNFDASLAKDDKQKGTVLYVLNPAESAAYIARQIPAETLPKEHS